MQTPENFSIDIDTENPHYHYIENPLNEYDTLVEKLRGVNVLLGVHDAGSFAALAPVMVDLDRCGADIRIITTGPSSKNFEPTIPESDANYDDLMNWIESSPTDITILGLSTNGKLEEALTLRAKLDRMKNRKQHAVLWISDYPGNVFRTYLESEFDPEFLPDILCVPNEWAKTEELKYNPLFPGERIAVTGLPSDDFLLDEDIDGTSARIRQELGLNDEHLITFMCTKRAGTAETLKALISALEHIDPKIYKLAIRQHPALSIDLESIMADGNNYLENLLIDTTNYSTDEVSMASDLVVTDTSTEGLNAIRRGIPTIHIWFEEVLKISFGDNLPSVLPVIADGSSLVAYNLCELAECLNKVLFDNKFCEELKEKMAKWRPTGNATKLVILEIIKLLKLN